MRLIDADALMEKLGERARKHEYDECTELTIYEDMHEVINAPAVDAETVCEQMGLVKEAFEMAKANLEPVRHGEWIDRYGGKYANHLWECSECKEKALWRFEVDALGKEIVVQDLSDFCPGCGAIMDGDSYE